LPKAFPRIGMIIGCNKVNPVRFLPSRTITRSRIQFFTPLNDWKSSSTIVMPFMSDTMVSQIRSNAQQSKMMS
jgi:hypothetical protein